MSASSSYLQAIESFSGVRVIERQKFQSNDNSFYDLYHFNDLQQIVFVQDSISQSSKAGTLKGMHFQKGEFAQAKLINCIQGSIMDFFVDLRSDQPTFMNYGSIKLDSANPKSLFIPRGFAHGYFTLEPNTVITYKLDNFYYPDQEYVLRWDDDQICIQWPNSSRYIISDKDKKGLSFLDLSARGIIRD